jgi:hypothetical protein
MDHDDVNVLARRIVSLRRGADPCDRMVSPCPVLVGTNRCPKHFGGRISATGIEDHHRVADITPTHVFALVQLCTDARPIVGYCSRALSIALL